MGLNYKAVDLPYSGSKNGWRAFIRSKLLIVAVIFLLPLNKGFSAVVEWNTFIGGSQTNGSIVNDVVIDNSGFIYVIGQAAGVWGSPQRSFGGFYDTFVAKYNSDGSRIWNTFLGGSQGDNGNGIALDTQGNIYVTGSSFSNASWGTPIRPIKASDAWVAKLNNNGNLIWNTFVGSTGGDDVGMSITVDSGGNPIVVGRADNAFGNSFSPSVPNINLLTPYHGGQDAFVLKLDSQGAIQFLTFVGSGLNQIPYGVAVDSNDNIYLSGESNQSFGAPVRAYTGDIDLFTVKLNSAGALQWNTFLGGPRNEFSGRVAIDANDNVYVTGGGLETWGTPLNAFSSFGDINLAKLNTAGALQWNTFAGDNGNESGTGIDIDASGNVHVSGTSSSFTFGPVNTPPSTPKAGSFDPFAAEFNPAGTLLAVNFVGSPSSDTGTQIAVDSAGNIVNVGNTRDWGFPIVPTQTTSNAFISKICADCIPVTASSDAFGTVVRDVNGALPGGTASMLVTPTSGYITDAVVGGTCAAGSFNGNVYTTGIVNASCTVDFTHSNYTVDASVENNGSVAPTSATTSSGTAVDFTVTPDPGFFVSETQVFGNCPAGSWSGNVYTTGLTTQPCNLFFEPQPLIFTVDASVDNNGSLIVQVDEDEFESVQSTSRSVNQGDTTTFTIQADQGFITDSAVGGSCPAGTFQVVRQDLLYTTGEIVGHCTVTFTHTAQPVYNIVAASAVNNEGDAGTTNFTFTVSRTTDISAVSTVDYQVSFINSSSLNTDDFGGSSPAGTVNFTEGETSKEIVILVSGDVSIESDEMFDVVLLNPVNGSIGTGTASGTIINDDIDSDSDGVADSVDNCPAISNQNQADNDGDLAGDVCDQDDDDDTVNDDVDNCQFLANLGQENNDEDAFGDLCDNDDDNDTILDQDDNCQFDSNRRQLDTDLDLLGDACDTDDDEDGVLDDDDNCPLIANADQIDSDEDGVGDLCPPDEGLCIPVVTSTAKVALICL